MPTRWKDNNLLLPSLVGTPLGIPNIRKDFKKILKQYELPDIRFHDLRHTIASILINEKVPIPQVSYILGHRDSTVRLSVYPHLISTDQEQFREVMDNILTPPIPLEKFILSQNNREVVMIDKD
jgi:integrase